MSIIFQNTYNNDKNFKYYEAKYNKITNKNKSFTSSESTTQNS